MDIKVFSNVRTSIKLDDYKTEKKEKSLTQIYEEKIEDIFEKFDRDFEQIKKDDREFYERMDKKKRENEIQKRNQRQKIESKAAAAEKSGIISDSELTAESKQVLMKKTPELLSKYKENKKWIEHKSNHVSKLV